jgi:hypothetical protein
MAKSEARSGKTGKGKVADGLLPNIAEIPPLKGAKGDVYICRLHAFPSPLYMVQVCDLDLP